MPEVHFQQCVQAPDAVDLKYSYIKWDTLFRNHVLSSILRNWESLQFSKMRTPVVEKWLGDIAMGNVFYYKCKAIKQC